MPNLIINPALLAGNKRVNFDEQNDLVLGEKEKTFHVLNSGKNLMQQLSRLHELDYRIIFQGNITIENQIALLELLRIACEKENIRVPHVSKMGYAIAGLHTPCSSRDNDEYVTITEKDPDKSLLRKSFETSMRIKPIAQNIVLDNDKASVDAAAKEGYRAILVDENSNLSQVLDSIIEEILLEREKLYEHLHNKQKSRSMLSFLKSSSNSSGSSSSSGSIATGAQAESFNITNDYLAIPKETPEETIKDDKKTSQTIAQSQNAHELSLQGNIRVHSSHVPIHHHVRTNPQSWHRSIFQGKPIEYWQDKWKTAKGSDYDKALSLLIEYSGGYKTLIGPGYWCYSIGRFFKGHWNTHHGTAVSQVIDAHTALASTVYDVDSNRRTVTNLLGDLKTRLDDVNLKSAGDLARILTIIKNNTDIDYKQVSIDRHGIKALQ